MLSKIWNVLTNFIICLPLYTSKYGRYNELPNRRVEWFHNLLYSDNATFKYLHLLDCNKYLKQEAVFSQVSITLYKIVLNNYGCKVFSDINRLQIQISACNTKGMEMGIVNQTQNSTFDSVHWRNDVSDPCQSFAC